MTAHSLCHSDSLTLSLFYIIINVMSYQLSCYLTTAISIESSIEHWIIEPLIAATKVSFVCMRQRQQSVLPFVSNNWYMIVTWYVTKKVIFDWSSKFGSLWSSHFLKNGDLGLANFFEVCWHDARTDAHQTIRKQLVSFSFVARLPAYYKWFVELRKLIVSSFQFSVVLLCWWSMIDVSNKVTI